MSDVSGRTRSWFMVHFGPTGRTGSTRLLFGSVVVRLQDEPAGAKAQRAGHSALSGFHRLYSRLLLSAAASRLCA